MVCEKLIARAARMGIAMTPAQAQAMETYHNLLTQANRIMNLTRVPDDEDEAIDRNYLDSLALLSAPALTADVTCAADIGSGAGFPGIPLAIMRPDISFTLIDSLGKRVQFLSDVIATLSLHARAVHLRAEDAGRAAAHRAQYDLTISRAVAGLNVLAELMLPLTRPGGHMIAYKGPSVQEELTQAAHAIPLLGGRVSAVVPVNIPGRDWAHNLAIIEKVAVTPAKYPRKAGEPTRNPLV